MRMIVDRCPYISGKTKEPIFRFIIMCKKYMYLFRGKCLSPGGNVQIPKLVVVGA